jgi:hypothetical protein
MVDALVSGTSARKGVGVRLSLRAQLGKEFCGCGEMVYTLP